MALALSCHLSDPFHCRRQCNPCAQQQHMKKPPVCLQIKCRSFLRAYSNASHGFWHSQLFHMVFVIAERLNTGSSLKRLC